MEDKVFNAFFVEIGQLFDKYCKLLQDDDHKEFTFGLVGHYGDGKAWLDDVVIGDPGMLEELNKHQKGLINSLILKENKNGSN